MIVTRRFRIAAALAAAIVITSVITLRARQEAAPEQQAAAEGAKPSAADAWDVTKARGTTRAIDFTIDEGTWMTVDVFPTGDRLAFDLLGHIYAMPAAGGEATVLTGDSGVALNFQPAISPDGKKIAFISDRGGQNNLWVMDADGRNPRVVEQNLKVRHSLPAWTPDSRFIVVRRTSLGDMRREVELWLYHAEGGKGVQLTKASEQSSASEPSVSADGKYLYFTIEMQGIDDPAKGRTQLRRLTFDGGDVLKVTDGVERGPGGDARLSSGGGFAARPSPDGRWLAFGRRLASGTISFKGRQLGPRTALWLRDLRTGAERLLVDPLDRDLQQDVSDYNGALPGYAWSKDGATIFIGTGGKIRRVDVASGKSDIIPFTARVQRTISQQAYAPFRIEEKKPLDVKFFRWPAASAQEPRRIAFQAVGRIFTVTGSDAPKRLLADSFTPHQYAPAFSADGQWIAFTSWTDADRGHVYKVAAGGGEPIKLTTEAAEYINPVWSPDGKTIVAARSSGATFRGQMLAENNWYDLVAIDAGSTAGAARTIVTVNPPNGRLSHRRASVKPSFGPDGRVFYPEIFGEGPLRTELRSVKLDGSDRRTHATVPEADEVAVSPDGKWLAFQEGDNVYLTAMPPQPIGSATLAIKREDKPIWKITALSTRGGNFPRFASNDLLVFGSANSVMLHDLRTGKTDTRAIKLEVPRDDVTGAVVLKNARIITAEGDTVIERGDIAVVDGRITAVGKSGAVKAPANARVFDLAGNTVMPGLVDMHTHNHRSAAGILPQRDYEMAAALANGVTASLDNSMWSQNIFPQSEMVETGDIVGPRVWSTGDPLYAGDHSRMNELKSLDVTRNEILRLKAYGAVSLKQYQQPERRQRQWVSEVARAEGLMVTAEGGDLLYILSMIMDGQTGWEHAIPQLPLYADAATFLGKANAYYSATLVVAGPGPWNDQYWTQESELWMNEKLKRFAPWRKLEAHTRQRDVRPATDYTYPMLAQGMADIIAAGGYGAIGAHGQQHGIASQWEVWMLASAMRPIDAIRVATLHGAKFLGIDRDTGSIAPGKLADLLVLRGNPLQDIKQTANIRYVIRGGRVYDGDTLDEQWPRQKPYGKFFWEMNEARPNDVKTIR